MRILFLDQFSDPGGAQQVLLDLLPAVVEAGWQPLVAMPGDGEIFRRVGELGIETARIACGPYNTGRKSASDVLRFFADTSRLPRQIRRMDADLVYINGPRLLPAATMAGLRAPVVFHSHSYLDGITRKLAGEALRRMNVRVLASSHFVAAVWRPYAEDIRVVYNGVAASASAEPQSPPQIACIGRIAPEKGQREFLRAAAMIHESLPDSRFVVCGSAMFSDPSYEAEVREAAVSLPVEFTGWMADVAPVLRAASLLLVPSTAPESTPRVIMEAFAAGVPVVAFPSGGIPELVDHGVNGFLVNSSEEMAQAALRVLSGERARLSQAARESWRRRFTLDRFRHEVISILNSMAAAPANAAAPASTGP